MKLYLYEYHTEFKTQLYGFKNFRERILFADLINVNGVGPRTAMSMLSMGWEKLVNQIATGQVDIISRTPYVGTKVASQIIFALQSKWQKMANKELGDKIDVEKIKQEEVAASELETSLKILGYRQKQIKYALDKVDNNGNLEAMIERAIVEISQSPEFKN